MHSLLSVRCLSHRGLFNTHSAIHSPIGSLSSFNQHHILLSRYSSKAEFIDGKRYYSREEVGKHDRATDGWIVVDDKVYNVTNWIPYHPGGEKVLLDVLGRDATRAFKRIGHSWMALDELDSLEIGYIKERRRYMVNEPDKNPKYFGEPLGFH